MTDHIPISEAWIVTTRGNETEECVKMRNAVVVLAISKIRNTECVFKNERFCSKCDG